MSGHPSVPVRAETRAEEETDFEKFFSNHYSRLSDVPLVNLVAYNHNGIKSSTMEASKQLQPWRLVGDRKEEEQPQLNWSPDISHRQAGELIGDAKYTNPFRKQRHRSEPPRLRLPENQPYERGDLGQAQAAPQQLAWHLGEPEGTAKNVKDGDNVIPKEPVVSDNKHPGSPKGFKKRRKKSPKDKKGLRRDGKNKFPSKKSRSNGEDKDEKPSDTRGPRKRDISGDAPCPVGYMPPHRDKTPFKRTTKTFSEMRAANPKLVNEPEQQVLIPLNPKEGETPCMQGFRPPPAKKEIPFKTTSKPIASPSIRSPYNVKKASSFEPASGASKTKQEGPGKGTCSPTTKRKHASKVTDTNRKPNEEAVVGEVNASTCYPSYSSPRCATDRSPSKSSIRSQNSSKKSFCGAKQRKTSKDRKGSCKQSKRSRSPNRSGCSNDQQQGKPRLSASRESFRTSCAAAGQAAMSGISRSVEPHDAKKPWENSSKTSVRSRSSKPTASGSATRNQSSTTVNKDWTKRQASWSSLADTCTNMPTFLPSFYEDYRLQEKPSSIRVTSSQTSQSRPQRPPSPRIDYNSATGGNMPSPGGASSPGIARPLNDSATNLISPSPTRGGGGGKKKGSKKKGKKSKRDKNDNKQGRGKKRSSFGDACVPAYNPCRESPGSESPSKDGKEVKARSKSPSADVARRRSRDRAMACGARGAGSSTSQRSPKCPKMNIKFPQPCRRRCGQSMARLGMIGRIGQAIGGQLRAIAFGNRACNFPGMSSLYIPSVADARWFTYPESHGAGTTGQPGAASVSGVATSGHTSTANVPGSRRSDAPTASESRSGDRVPADEVSSTSRGKSDTGGSEQTSKGHSREGGLGGGGSGRGLSKSESRDGSRGASRADTRGGSPGESRRSSRGDPGESRDASRGVSRGDTRGGSPGESRRSSRGDPGESRDASRGVSRGDTRGGSPGESRLVSRGDTRVGSSDESRGASRGKSQGGSPDDSRGARRGDPRSGSPDDSRNISRGASRDGSHGPSRGKSQDGSRSGSQEGSRDDRSRRTSDTDLRKDPEDSRGKRRGSNREPSRRGSRSDGQSDEDSRRGRGAHGRSETPDDSRYGSDRPSSTEDVSKRKTGKDNGKRSLTEPEGGEPQCCRMRATVRSTKDMVKVDIEECNDACSGKGSWGNDHPGSGRRRGKGGRDQKSISRGMTYDVSMGAGSKPHRGSSGGPNPSGGSSGRKRPMKSTDDYSPPSDSYEKVNEYDDGGSEQQGKTNKRTGRPVIIDDEGVEKSKDSRAKKRGDNVSQYKKTLHVSDTSDTYNNYTKESYSGKENESSRGSMRNRIVLTSGTSEGEPNIKVRCVSSGSEQDCKPVYTRRKVIKQQKGSRESDDEAMECSEYLCGEDNLVQVCTPARPDSRNLKNDDEVSVLVTSDSNKSASNFRSPGRAKRSPGRRWGGGQLVGHHSPRRSISGSQLSQDSPQTGLTNFSSPSDSLIHRRYPSKSTGRREIKKIVGRSPSPRSSQGRDAHHEKMHPADTCSLDSSCGTDPRSIETKIRTLRDKHETLCNGDSRVLRGKERMQHSSMDMESREAGDEMSKSTSFGFQNGILRLGHAQKDVHILKCDPQDRSAREAMSIYIPSSKESLHIDGSAYSLERQKPSPESVAQYKRDSQYIRMRQMRLAKLEQSLHATDPEANGFTPKSEYLKKRRRFQSSKPKDGFSVTPSGSQSGQRNRPRSFSRRHDLLDQFNRIITPEQAMRLSQPRNVGSTDSEASVVIIPTEELYKRMPNIKNNLQHTGRAQNSSRNNERGGVVTELAIPSVSPLLVTDSVANGESYTSTADQRRASQCLSEEHFSTPPSDNKLSKQKRSSNMDSQPRCHNNNQINIQGGHSYTVITHRAHSPEKVITPNPYTKNNCDTDTVSDILERLETLKISNSLGGVQKTQVTVQDGAGKICPQEEHYTGTSSSTHGSVKTDCISPGYNLQGYISTLGLSVSTEKMVCNYLKQCKEEQNYNTLAGSQPRKGYPDTEYYSHESRVNEVGKKDCRKAYFTTENVSRGDPRFSIPSIHGHSNEWLLELHNTNQSSNSDGFDRNTSAADTEHDSEETNGVGLVDTLRLRSTSPSPSPATVDTVNSVQNVFPVAENNKQSLRSPTLTRLKRLGSPFCRSWSAKFPSQVAAMKKFFPDSESESSPSSMESDDDDLIHVARSLPALVHSNQHNKLMFERIRNNSLQALLYAASMSNLSVSNRSYSKLWECGGPRRLQQEWRESKRPLATEDEHHHCLNSSHKEKNNNRDTGSPSTQSSCHDLSEIGCCGTQPKRRQVVDSATSCHSLTPIFVRAQQNLSDAFKIIVSAVIGARNNRLEPYHPNTPFPQESLSLTKEMQREDPVPGIPFVKLEQGVNSAELIHFCTEDNENFWLISSDAMEKLKLLPDTSKVSTVSSKPQAIPSDTCRIDDALLLQQSQDNSIERLSIQEDETPITGPASPPVFDEALEDGKNQNNKLNQTCTESNDTYSCDVDSPTKVPVIEISPGSTEIWHPQPVPQPCYFLHVNDLFASPARPIPCRDDGGYSISDGQSTPSAYNESSCEPYCLDNSTDSRSGVKGEAHKSNKVQANVNTSHKERQDTSTEEENERNLLIKKQASCSDSKPRGSSVDPQMLPVKPGRSRERSSVNLPYYQTGGGTVSEESYSNEHNGTQTNKSCESIKRLHSYYTGTNVDTGSKKQSNRCSRERCLMSEEVAGTDGDKTIPQLYERRTRSLSQKRKNTQREFQMKKSESEIMKYAKCASSRSVSTHAERCGLKSSKSTQIDASVSLPSSKTPTTGDDSSSKNIFDHPDVVVVSLSSKSCHSPVKGIDKIIPREKKSILIDWLRTVVPKSLIDSGTKDDESSSSENRAIGRKRYSSEPRKSHRHRTNVRHRGHSADMFGGKAGSSSNGFCSPDASRHSLLNRNSSQSGESGGKRRRKRCRRQSNGATNVWSPVDKEVKSPNSSFGLISPGLDHQADIERLVAKKPKHHQVVDEDPLLERRDKYKSSATCDSHKLRAPRSLHERSDKYKQSSAADADQSRTRSTSLELRNKSKSPDIHKSRAHRPSSERGDSHRTLKKDDLYQSHNHSSPLERGDKCKSSVSYGIHKSRVKSPSNEEGKENISSDIPPLRAPAPCVEKGGKNEATEDKVQQSTVKRISRIGGTRVIHPGGIYNPASVSSRQIENMSMIQRCNDGDEDARGKAVCCEHDSKKLETGGPLRDNADKTILVPPEKVEESQIKSQQSRDVCMSHCGPPEGHFSSKSSSYFSCEDDELKVRFDRLVDELSTIYQHTGESLYTPMMPYDVMVETPTNVMESFTKSVENEGMSSILRLKEPSFSYGSQFLREFKWDEEYKHVHESREEGLMRQYSSPYADRRSSHQPSWPESGVSPRRWRDGLYKDQAWRSPRSPSSEPRLDSIMAMPLSLFRGSSVPHVKFRENESNNRFVKEREDHRSSRFAKKSINGRIFDFMPLSDPLSEFNSAFNGDSHGKYLPRFNWNENANSGLNDNESDDSSSSKSSIDDFLEMEADRGMFSSQATTRHKCNSNYISGACSSGASSEDTGLTINLMDDSRHRQIFAGQSSRASELKQNPYCMCQSCKCHSNNYPSAFSRKLSQAASRNINGSGNLTGKSYATSFLRPTFTSSSACDTAGITKGMLQVNDACSYRASDEEFASAMENVQGQGKPVHVWRDRSEMDETCNHQQGSDSNIGFFMGDGPGSKLAKEDYLMQMESLRNQPGLTDMGERAPYRNIAWTKAVPGAAMTYSTVQRAENPRDAETMDNGMKLRASHGQGDHPPRRGLTQWYSDQQTKANQGSGQLCYGLNQLLRSKSQDEKGIGGQQANDTIIAANTKGDEDDVLIEDEDEEDDEDDEEEFEEAVEEDENEEDSEEDGEELDEDDECEEEEANDDENHNREVTCRESDLSPIAGVEVSGAESKAAGVNKRKASIADKDVENRLSETEKAATKVASTTNTKQKRFSIDQIKVPAIEKERVRFACDENGDWAEIGRGSYGCVYLGLLDGSIEVAIKDFYEASSWELVIHEARMLLFLQDTGITPRLYGLRRRFDVSKQPSEYCIIMEYFGDGRTLFNVLSDKIALRTDEWLDIVGQLVAGLRLIHRKGVLINDLKADNILVDLTKGRKVIRYIDVGMATYKQGLTFQLPEDQMNRYNFLAPEVREGGRTTARSDIYSLGYMLEQMCRMAESALGELRKLVARCMDKRASRRPDLDDIVSQVHRFIGAKAGRAMTSTSSRQHSV